MWRTVVTQRAQKSTSRNSASGPSVAGQALFPRGADHQVGIGLPRGIQVFADGFYGHRVDEFATVAVAHARQARRDRTQVFCGQQADGNQSDAIKRLRLRKL